MGVPPRRFSVLAGGRTERDPPGRPAGSLRLIQGGKSAEMELALAEAVEAAREMRREIERRIASALDGFEERR